MATSSRAFLEAAIHDSSAMLPTKVHVPGSNTVATVQLPPKPSDGRKLVTIRRVAAIEQLTKTYGVATIDGWKILVLNAEGFQPDELVVFCEVDSFLSHKSPYSKLFEPWATLQMLDGEEGWRIATQQMAYRRGSEKIQATSQGRIFKIKQFPTIVRDFRALKMEATRAGHTSFEDFLRNVDFADTLGIKKWEPQLMPAFTPAAAANTAEAPGIIAPCSGLAAAPTLTTVPSSVLGATSLPNPKTPSFVPTTKIERHQNCPNLFIKPKYRRYVYQQTIKLDGSAMSLYFIKKNSRFFDRLPLLNSQTLQAYLTNFVFENGRVGICSSNKDIVYTAQSVQGFITTAIGLGFPKLLAKIGHNIVLQGELVGHNILGNPYGYADPIKQAGKNINAGGKTGDCGNGHDFFLYSITDLDTGKKWSPKAVHAFATQYGIRHVPSLGYVRIPEIAKNHDELQAIADAAPGEGFVFKCVDDGRAFKVLSTKWILEKGDEAIARGERLRQGTAVSGLRPVIMDPLSHARNMPVELRRILESQSSKQTAVAASVAVKQTTTAPCVAVKQTITAPRVAAPAPVAAPPATSSAVPIATGQAARVAIPAPVVDKPAKNMKVEAPASTQVESPLKATIQTTRPQPTIKVTAPAGESANVDQPSNAWDRGLPTRLQFQAWAFGNDSQNIIKWVDAWVNNRTAREAFEAAERKHSAMVAQLKAQEHEMNVLFAAMKAAELHLEVQNHKRDTAMAEFPALEVPKVMDHWPVEQQVRFLTKWAAEQQGKESHDKQKRDEGKVEEMVEEEKVEDYKEEKLNFELNCAAEDSSSEISGVGENPEDETDSTTCTPSSARSETAPRPESSTSASGKQPMVSKETIAWLGL